MGLAWLATSAVTIASARCAVGMVGRIAVLPAIGAI